MGALASVLIILTLSSIAAAAAQQQQQLQSPSTGHSGGENRNSSGLTPVHVVFLVSVF